MSLSNAYNSCDTQLPDHFCDPCPDNREYGRIRSAGFINKTYLATLIAADPTLAASWQDGIDAGEIIVIPETSGTYDPGDPKELKGYGDRKNSNGPRDQQLSFFDPNYYDNYQFWNTIADATQYIPFYRTSSLVHIADVPASIYAKDPVEDDLEAEVSWNAIVKWQSRNLPTKHDATNLKDEIFACVAAA
jgi:hypothetical protein